MLWLKKDQLILKNDLENNKKHNEIGKKFNASCQQVGSWFLKYKESRLDALIDRRGKKTKKN